MVKSDVSRGVDDIGEAYAINDRELQAIADVLDVSGRGDLRRRIADGLEEWLLSPRREGKQVLLPSTRRLSLALGVHRATVNASLELLVERSVLVRAKGGRYMLPYPPEVGAETFLESEASLEVGSQLLVAAGLAVREGTSEAAFIVLAQRLYQSAAATAKPVVFVDAGARIPGIGPRELEAILDCPVIVQPLANIIPHPNMIFITPAVHVARVRAAFNGATDVFAVGLTLDTDIRLAVAELPPYESVTVVAEDPAVREFVVGRVVGVRPDLDVASRASLPEGPRPPGLLLVPEGMSVNDSSSHVQRYRCSISLAELTLVRARLLEPLEKQATVSHIGAVTVDGQARDEQARDALGGR